MEKQENKSNEFLEIELDLKKEKRKIKEVYNSNSLYDLEIILEKCFAMPKKKKEHFITRERLEVDIIRWLQTQKKFSSLKNVKEDITSLAVFDLEKNIIGKILKIDLINKEVEFKDLFLSIHTKPFDSIKFFDYYSIELVSFFDKQKMFCDKFSYRDTYHFLMDNEKNKDYLQKVSHCQTYSINSLMPKKTKEFS